MKSPYENLSDKLLFKLVKMIMEEVDFSDLENSQDYQLIDGINSVEGYFGVKSEDYTLDADFIYNLWKLNFESFEKETLTSPLYRPTIKKVTFDWTVLERQMVRSTYQHELETYGTNKDDMIDYLYGVRNDGNLNYYDGVEINTEVIDSEFEDDDIDDSSFKIV
jgi:hypothetical protein